MKQKRFIIKWKKTYSEEISYVRLSTLTDVYYNFNQVCKDQTVEKAKLYKDGKVIGEYEKKK